MEEEENIEHDDKVLGKTLQIGHKVTRDKVLIFLFKKITIQGENYARLQFHKTFSFC